MYHTILIMIFIEDGEGIFDVPLDKVWEPVNAYTIEGSRIHPNAQKCSNRKFR